MGSSSCELANFEQSNRLNAFTAIDNNLNNKVGAAAGGEGGGGGREEEEEEDKEQEG